MKKRVLSGIVMCLIVIPLLIIGGIPFKIGIGILGILAYKEIIDIKGLNNYPKIVVVLGLISMLFLIYAGDLSLGKSYIKDGYLFDYTGLSFRYLLLIFMIMFMPTVFLYNTKKYTPSDAFKLTSFVMFLGCVLNSGMTLFLREKNSFLLILLICIATDVFAYLVGRKLGKHKVTKISPNKSLEGFIGGAVMGTVIGTTYYILAINIAPIYRVIFVTLILSLTCEVGDLFYSAIKREIGKKDFSNLIPGHGGILDRIDSITFVTAMYIILYGII